MGEEEEEEGQYMEEQGVEATTEEIGRCKSQRATQARRPEVKPKRARRLRHQKMSSRRSRLLWRLPHKMLDLHLLPNQTPAWQSLPYRRAVRPRLKVCGRSSSLVSPRRRCTGP